MAKKTCDHCFGVGTIESGSYEHCASCGGSGHGSYTNVSCMSCHGSGKSTMPARETCWHCHGAGSVDVPDAPMPPVKTGPRTTVKPKEEIRKPRTSAQTSTQQNPNKVSEEIGGLAVLFAIIGAVILWNDNNNLNIVQIALAGGVFFIASYVGLFLLYYAIKVVAFVIQVAFVGAIIVIACNAMGFQWAKEIISLLPS
ncbi:hypothetical protein [Aestuariibacter sp. A3R04]|uniref:hypothetical protein n=1 Tax=Aestuariibacter sp. A3R04 TaxID=2841571 RepID=UPI001C09A954|nr:hypothetical protein [Aestuariibacter sp. A3R04]MBU3020509.1 hypothetical protein [Aestuariibacter sp. A3R04]